MSLTCGYPADINAGNARAYGPEVETSMRVTDGLTFSLSGAYTKAEINDPNATAQAAGFYPGIKIINVPEYTAVAALDYQQPINDKLAGVFHLSSSLVGPSRGPGVLPRDPAVAQSRGPESGRCRAPMGRRTLPPPISPTSWRR